MKSIKSQRFTEWYMQLKKTPSTEEAWNAGWEYAVEQAILMMREKEILWKESAKDFSVGVGVAASKIGADLL